MESYWICRRSYSAGGWTSWEREKQINKSITAAFFYDERRMWKGFGAFSFKKTFDAWLELISRKKKNLAGFWKNLKSNIFWIWIRACSQYPTQTMWVLLWSYIQAQLQVTVSILWIPCAYVMKGISVYLCTQVHNWAECDESLWRQHPHSQSMTGQRGK